MNHLSDRSENPVVEVINAQAASSIVLVCEHASAHIPERFEGLGLDDDACQSHIAWDPGALALATHIAAHLDATLVASKVSRLIYDCNRPPDAPDAMPMRSEVFDIPGNRDLDAAQRRARIAEFYVPFRAALAAVLAQKSGGILITLHSFTPIYHNARRAVEIGVLHDADPRLADALLSCAAQHLTHNVQRNEPYGPAHGVTHTLKEHALPGGHLNVMLEVRNDLIAQGPSQRAMATRLSAWVTDALARVRVAPC